MAEARRFPERGPSRPDFTTANTHGWRIASVSHTRSGVRWIDWYASACAGYEDTLDRAGVYELEQLLGAPWNFQRDVLVVVPDYVARRLAPSGRAPNDTRTWEALYLAALFQGRARPTWPRPWDAKKFRQELKQSVAFYQRVFPVGRQVVVDATETTHRIVDVAKLSGETVIVRVDTHGWIRCTDLSTLADPLLDLEVTAEIFVRRRPVLAAVVSSHILRAKAAARARRAAARIAATSGGPR